MTSIPRHAKRWPSILAFCSVVALGMTTIPSCSGSSSGSGSVGTDSGSVGTGSGSVSVSVSLAQDNGSVGNGERQQVCSDQVISVFGRPCTARPVRPAPSMQIVPGSA